LQLDAARMAPSAPDSAEFEHLVERVRSEFLEMPGLRLTAAQAARLWGLDSARYEEVVEVLVRREFLQRTASGAVARASG
jgi:hypothetical protein